MATLSVVSFRNGSPHGKIHILQESVNNKANKNNGNQVDKREIIILRKKPKAFQPIQPSVSVASLINQNSLLIPVSQENQIKAKKISKAKESASNRVHNPPPIAVARRNARERNRVKQVNNGFATLRQHIPNEIAEIFENANNNRAANKKLSKVETLRMAVEYIRSLESLLSIEENRDMNEHNANLSIASFPSPSSSESPQNGSSFEQGYFSLQSPILEDTDDSNPATPLPPVADHHYSRIPGTNTFHLITGPANTHRYEDEENVHPLTPTSDMIQDDNVTFNPNIIDHNMDYMQTNNQEFTIINPEMLSPNFYSENSTSPGQEMIPLDMKYVTTVNINPSEQILYPHSLVLEHPPMVPLILSTDIPHERFPRIKNTPTKDQLLLAVDDTLTTKSAFGRDIDLKQEPVETDRNFQTDDGDENMEDVMTWWETEGKHEDESLSPT